MTPSRLAAALCVLGALLVPASAQSAGAASALPFSDWLHAVKAGPSSRAKPMSDYEHAEIKHICLQETRQYNCRYVGCPDVDLYSGVHANGTCDGSVGCGPCQHNTVYQSDLTCCDSGKPYGYGGYGGDEGGFGSGVAAPTLKVGTCDWDFDLHTDLIVVQRRQPEGLQNANKVGTAWATCYLTAGADYCGGELCDNMVLSFQGVVHSALVRSTLETDLATDNPDSSCLGCESLASYLPSDSCRVPNPSTVVFNAIVIAGPVTLTSLDRQLEYTRGHMEYVPLAVGLSEDLANSIPDPESLSLVTPNTYNIKLVGKKGKDGYY